MRSLALQRLAMSANWLFPALASAALTSGCASTKDLGDAPAPPRFAAYHGDLTTFARALEAYCGLPAGALLKVSDQRTLRVSPDQPSTLTYGDFTCVMTGVHSQRLAKRGVNVVLVGEDLR